MDPYAHWLDWARELQALAQNSLAYTRDPYDKERFERVREISAEMMAHMTDIPLEKARDLFCNETGYQTPKLDTRAAVFKEEKILLVRENNGTWSLPGGWVDAHISVKENAVKEVWEEAGLEVTADRIIAVLDRNRHNTPLSAYSICNIFFLCTPIRGEFRPNLETTASGYFGLEELPRLSENKNTEAQIRMCFEAYRSENWQVIFD